MEKIVFKPEFEEKLKKLRIKRKYVTNLKQYVKRQNLNIQSEIRRLNKSIYWREFIYSAFLFEDTLQGYNFWRDIAKK